MWPPEGQGILPHIESPEDLKKVPLDRLPRLARELRERIIDVCYKTGGHFGANLGVVELSIALHYVFDFKSDTLVWDVGHQCYAHKLLTGRNARFDTLRQQGGLMGFPNPAESEYDAFCTGHAGTSVSTAWGIQLAHHLQGGDRRGVAVIGDASIATGMAFEALNHIGHAQKNMLVILNDNQMSIAGSVGAMHNYLNKFRIGHFYQEIKNDMKFLFEKIPGGESMRKSIRFVQDSIRHAMTPGMFFEALGFRYYGPVDGHDTAVLIDHLKQIHEMKGPVLLHVYTVKGKGYAAAEQDQRGYHGVKPKAPEKQESVAVPAPQGKAYTDIFAEEMIAIASEDPRLVALTAAMPDGTGLAKFAKTHPERMIDVGICEQHGVGLAAGLAKAGMKPVAAIYSTFLQRAYDQVHQEVCLQNLPVVFAMDRAGVVGDDGPTHHGMFDIGYLRVLPNITILAPKDDPEFRAMLRFCVDYRQGPTAIRYPRGNAPVEPLAAPAPIVLGKGEILQRGRDVAILAYGAMVGHALKAARELAARDIYATVFNARFVKPLDREAILQMAGTHPVLITVEDHQLQAGFGSAVLELLHDSGCDGVKVRRLGHPDRYVEHASIPALYRQSGIDAEAIIHTACEACRETIGAEKSRTDR